MNNIIKATIEATKAMFMMGMIREIDYQQIAKHVIDEENIHTQDDINLIIDHIIMTRLELAN